VGPWDPTAQHAGPPAALLTRELERCSPREDLVLARITCEILGPVPVEGELSALARVTRAGRSVELLEAELAAGGRVAMRATAWRVRPAPVTAGPPGGPAPPPRPPAERPLPEGWRRDGYLAAVEWRFARGDWAEPGPAAVWSRLRVGIVEGEEPSPLQRLLAVADSGNGASSELELRSWLFINPELTVHVLRAPRGEWICLDATTTIHAGGAGTALSVLSDDDGPVAHGAQSLLVAPR
jgi:hypothetical protein